MPAAAPVSLQLHDPNRASNNFSDLTKRILTGGQDNTLQANRFGLQRVLDTNAAIDALKKQALTNRGSLQNTALKEGIANDALIAAASGDIGRADTQRNIDLTSKVAAGLLAAAGGAAFAPSGTPLDLNTLGKVQVSLPTAGALKKAGATNITTGTDTTAVTSTDVDKLPGGRSKASKRVETEQRKKLSPQPPIPEPGAPVERTALEERTVPNQPDQATITKFADATAIVQKALATKGDGKGGIITDAGNWVVIDISEGGIVTLWNKVIGKVIQRPKEIFE